MTKIDIYAIGYRDDVPDNTRVINTTSRSVDGGKIFSPFFIGDVNFENGYAKNVENAWQYSKVWKEHINEDGSIKDEYYKWREEGFNNSKAIRYPMGKGNDAEFSLLGEKRMGYQEAKDKIYKKIYIEAFKNNKKAVAIIKELVNEAISKGYNLAFKDFDVNLDTWLNNDLNDIIYSNAKCGHGYLVAQVAKNYYEKIKT
jgi:hypothetical protein